MANGKAVGYDEAVISIAHKSVKETGRTQIESGDISLFSFGEGALHAHRVGVRIVRAANETDETDQIDQTN